VSEAATNQWRRRSAWEGVLQAGRIGQADGEAGVRVAPREGLAMATIIAGDGRSEAVGKVLADLVGVALPPPLKVSSGRSGELVWSGPDHWLFVGKERALVAEIAARLAGLAAVSDQSDARAILRASGPRVREALAKGCMVDLHPRVFQPGSTALTTIAYIGVQLWQVDEAPSYDLAVFRSLAGSFW
jgi:sarcosine oxidase subunit gamma